MKVKTAGRKTASTIATSTTKPTAPRRTKKPAKRTSPIKAAKRPAALPSPAATRDGSSKQAQLITALRAASGTTIKQMMAVTRWQAHTVRGTISGVLRKKLGLNVVCQSSAQSGERVYRIVGSAASA
jgi:hypothetical protein